ncbi:MAG TPA: DUF4157 domain-containing protein [Polyangia bacterium]|nr:DUF4157 domain-containing protein [Polyangia bacterium]
MSSYAPLIRKPAARDPKAKSEPPKTAAPPATTASPDPAAAKPLWPGGRLPFFPAVQRAFGPDHDLGEVRAHQGPDAAAASRALGARAYTAGARDVVFGETPTLARAAHEAAHVVQQAAGAVSPRAAQRPGDPLERHADAVAARVTAGESAADLLAPYPMRRAPAEEVIQRDAAPGAAPLPPQSAGVVDAVVAALSKPDEVAGVGDFGAAFAALAQLPMDQQLAALRELDQRGQLDLLLANEPIALARPDGARVVAALRTVRVARAGTSAATQDELVSDAERIAAVLALDLDAILRFLMQVMPALAAEGTMALYMMSSALPLLPGAVAAAGGGGVMPGNFAPPGNQPIPLYIGQSAHDGIADFYVSRHLGDQVETNRIAVSTILGLLRTAGKPNDPTALPAKDLGLEPDITNLTKLHLYEIKPQAAEGVGATEARMYLGIFVAAGVPMTLGPVTEPGTAGIIPAPGGYYTFEAVQPGVIVYQYRRGRYEPVTVPVESPEGQKDFIQKMQDLTRLSGIALAIYIILSEGSRVAFPPRNAIPAP